jgi:hypothetical protein
VSFEIRCLPREGLAPQVDITSNSTKLLVRTILPESSFVRLLMRAAAGAIYRRALAGAR